MSREFDDNETERQLAIREAEEEAGHVSYYAEKYGLSEIHDDALDSLANSWFDLIRDGERLLKNQEKREYKAWVKAGGKISIAEAIEHYGIKPEVPVELQPVKIAILHQRQCEQGLHQDVNYDGKKFIIPSHAGFMVHCIHCGLGLHYATKREVQQAGIRQELAA